MGRLKALKLEHYRGFFEEQTIEFARPDNTNAGSGLTLIVGPNNTGKTSIIESLLLNESKKFKESERHLSYNPPKITIETDNEKCVFSNIDNGSQIKLVDGSRHTIQFEIIQSRRYFNQYSRGDLNVEQFLNQTVTPEVRNSSGIDTTAVLKGINKDKEKKDKFRELMRNIIPHFTDWTIDTNDQGDYVKYIANDSEHQANFLGDGIMSMFRICAHLISDGKSRVFIVDEPELSLHPSAQKSLSLVLSEMSKEKQIILCTHSPYMINWKDFLNGACFIRLNKINDKECTVSKLENTKDYKSFIGSNIIEWQKPQFLDTVAKEILFTDRILFVEGQEDVGLIRKWFYDNNKTLNFDIFGYGVSGYSNMKLFLEMAKDLELSKVAALYDKGGNGDKCYEDDKNNYKQYHFEQLPTEDIRDKTGVEKGSFKKVGCFDNNGSLKKEYTAVFGKVMDNIIGYMDS